MVNLKVKILHPGLIEHGLQYATDGSAAFDVRLAIHAPVELYPEEQKLLDLGFAMAVPDECAALLISRSGIPKDLRIRLGNGVGLIDSDYRGPVKVLLHNYAPPGTKVVRFEPWERVGQIVIVPVVRPVIELVDSLDETPRGDGGFGSTGRG